MLYAANFWCFSKAPFNSTPAWPLLQTEIHEPPDFPSLGKIIIPFLYKYAFGKLAGLRHGLSSRLDVMKTLSLDGMKLTVHMFFVFDRRRGEAKFLRHYYLRYFIYAYPDQRHMMYGMLQVV